MCLTQERMFHQLQLKNYRIKQVDMNKEKIAKVGVSQSVLKT